MTGALEMDDAYRDALKHYIEEHIKLTSNNPTNWTKDFSVLQDFTDEELAAELCRRTSLGKELE